MESKHITKENHQTMMVQTKEKEMKRKYKTTRKHVIK